MHFNKTEVANLPNKAVVLGSLFESPGTMRHRGEALVETAIISGVAATAMVMSGVAVGAWEKIRHDNFPGRGGELLKAGVGIATLAIGEYYAGDTVEKTAEQIRVVRRRIASANRAAKNAIEYRKVDPETLASGEEAGFTETRQLSGERPPATEAEQG